ncbi:MAG: hypothetical protein DI598_19715 [Pseudopedobacter saltans]|uniref:Uncharacterized protein n=1 Tax=Pseudopedobacter saltans TaxID=151895 RepID=A0A2W5EAP6_9SPHI|nr:MAG: hypothetical protein DI598_19715 [Pseudopedobacter saltans]
MLIIRKDKFFRNFVLGIKNIKFNFFEFQDFLSFDFILIIENQTFCYENVRGILFETRVNTKSSFFS